MGNAIRRGTDGDRAEKIFNYGYEWSTQTISGGQMTFADSMVTLDTEGSAASDDLDEILGGQLPGRALLIRNANVNRRITLVHLSGSGGNIYNPAQTNITLIDPQAHVELMWNGSNWVVQNPGSGGGIAPDWAPLTEDDVDVGGGQTVECVAAARARTFVNAVIDAVYDQLPGTPLLLSVTLTPYIGAATGYISNPSALNALGLLLSASPYGSQANFDAIFTTDAYDLLQCILHVHQASPGFWSLSEYDSIRADLNALGTDAAAAFWKVLGVIGWGGLNNSIWTDYADTSAIDCTTCFWCEAGLVDFDNAATGGLVVRSTDATYPFAYPGYRTENGGGSGSARPSYSAGDMSWTGTGGISGVANHHVACAIELPDDCTLGTFSFWYFLTGSTLGAYYFVLYVSYWDASKALIGTDQLVYAGTNDGAHHNTWVNYAVSPGLSGCKWVSVSGISASGGNPTIYLDYFEVNA